MPLLLFKNLVLDNLKPYTNSLQLAHHSVNYPERKAGKFHFPTNFLMFKMVGDSKILVFLGRPFLTLGKIMMYVQNGKLIL